MSATTSSDVIARRLAALRAEGRRALVIYVTAGHPTVDESIALIRGLPTSGADIIEVGVPFSDPLADGPVIQASSQQVLAAGMDFTGVLDIVARARAEAPTVLFSYLNPLLSAGPDALDRAADAGASGLLVTDLPVGADPPLEARFGESPLAFIRLVAPTTPPARMAEIARHGSGFVYLISRLGVTGARADVPAELPRTVALLREATTLPICVGFGISRPEQAAAVGRLADGVAVGSAVVSAAAGGADRALELVRTLRAGLDAL
ncbi:MAG TPA: tryptophan synthase subunit alpha [Gemmatimonadaceae bacterium]|nr:tryptophan synthase subunit alpha [Gemmatimonadaceae bacterium]